MQVSREHGEVVQGATRQGYIHQPSIMSLGVSLVKVTDIMDIAWGWY